MRVDRLARSECEVQTRPRPAYTDWGSRSVAVSKLSESRLPRHAARVRGIDKYTQTVTNLIATERKGSF